MNFTYTVQDLVEDMNHGTIIDRHPNASYSFQLGNGALRKEAAIAKYMMSEMLDRLFLTAQFGMNDNIMLSFNNISDVDASAFLEKFVTANIPLPFIDVSGNPISVKSAETYMRIVKMERKMAFAASGSTRLRFALFFDTALNISSLRSLQYNNGSPTVIQMLPIPDRVLLLAEEAGSLLDAEKPMSSSCARAHVGRFIWAGFLAPMPTMPRRDIEIRLYKNDANASVYIEEITRVVFSLGVRHLFSEHQVDSMTFSHVSTNKQISNIRKALAKTSVRHAEFVEFVPEDAAVASVTMQSILEAIPSLTCVVWIDPSTAEFSRCVGRKQLACRNKRSVVLREDDLLHATPMIDEKHARVWLIHPAASLFLHDIPHRTLPLTSLLHLLDLQSNVVHVSLSYTHLTVEQLQTLLLALPNPPCCCVKHVDLRNSNLILSEMWNLLKQFSHITFEYNVESRPLVNGLTLEHRPLKNIIHSEKHQLSFQATVSSMKRRARADPVLSLHISSDMSDDQLAAHLTEYVEGNGHLPSMVSLVNTAASVKVVQFLAQYLYTLTTLNVETPKTVIDFSNTAIDIAAVRALPFHCSVFLFPRTIPDSHAIQFKEVHLNENNIIEFIESGGTDASRFEWIACNKMIGAWPGMFSLSTMYSTYFKILSRRANPPIRAFSLVDRVCSTMNLSDLLSVFVQHMHHVEYILLAQMHKWDVDTRMSKRYSAEANDISFNRILFAAVSMLAGTIPTLANVDVLPPHGVYREASASYVKHVNEEVLSCYHLSVNYLHKLPNYVGFCGGIVYGRVVTGADNVLLNSDSTHLPFSTDDIVMLMARRGHGQHALSLASRGTDVTDNTLIALYLQAVPPLEVVDFSGTAITMTGIQLLADHPEVTSSIHKLFFANIPSLMRIPQMEHRSELFSGIAASASGPTKATIERMRLAHSIVLPVSSPLPIGAKTLRDAPSQKTMEIETGDELLMFLQRASLIQRRNEFTSKIDGNTMMVGYTLFDWSSLSDTLFFSAQTAALWSEMESVLFLSFFIFAELHEVIRRMVFSEDVAPTDGLLNMLHASLPGVMEFVVHNSSNVTSAFYKAQWLRSMSYHSHTFVFFADRIPEDVVLNDALCFLARRNRHIVRVLSAGNQSFQRHLPYFLASAGRCAWIQGAPLKSLLDILAGDSASVFGSLWYLVMTEMTGMSDLFHALTADRLLRVFPHLRNIVLTLQVPSDAFSDHRDTILHPYLRAKSNVDFHWTDTRVQHVLMNSTDLMGEITSVKPDTALWLEDGVFHPPFMMEFAHRKHWKRVMGMLKSNVSTITTLDLSNQRISIDLFSEETQAFVWIESYIFTGAELSADVAEGVWVDLERIVRIRAARSPALSTSVILDDAHLDFIRRHHSSFYEWLQQAPSIQTSTLVVIQDASLSAVEDGIVAEDVESNNESLHVHHVIRHSFSVSDAADENVRRWAQQVDATVIGWRDADVRSAATDTLYHALAKHVLESLSEQHLDRPYHFARFAHPQFVLMHQAVLLAESARRTNAPATYYAILNLFSTPRKIQCEEGFIIVVGEKEWILAPHNALLLEGIQPVFMLCMQVNLFEHETPIHEIIGNDLYDRMHRIQKSTVVVPVPPSPHMPDIPVPEEDVPILLPPVEPTVNPEAWGGHLDDAIAMFVRFLHDDSYASMTPFVGTRAVGKKNVLWVGFYANHSVRIRSISFVGATRNFWEKHVNKFKKALAMRVEHTFVFARMPDSPTFLTISVHSSLLEKDFTTLSIPRNIIRNVSETTFDSKWELSYPYLQPTSLVPITIPANVEEPPAEIPLQRMEVEPPLQQVVPISVREFVPFMEKEGFVYESYLGRGATSHVIRVASKKDGTHYAAKLFFKRDDYVDELNMYDELSTLSLKSFILMYVFEFEFPENGISVQSLLGDIGAERLLPLEHGGPIVYEGGAVLLPLMDGSLFAEVPIASYHTARFLLLLQSTPAWMEELLSWLKKAEDALVRARVFHGDLATRNILYQWDEGTNQMQFQITDFGKTKISEHSEEEIRHKWGVLRDKLQRWADRKIFMEKEKHMSWQQVTVTYESGFHRLWVAESNPIETFNEPHVTLYTNMDLNPPPSWKDTWMPTIDIFFHPEQQMIIIRNPQKQVFSCKGNVEMHNIGYDLRAVDRVMEGMVVEPVLNQEQPTLVPTPENAESLTESGQDVTMKTEQDEWKSFLMNKHEMRRPFMRVMTGGPDLLVGFVDEASGDFECVTFRFPRFIAEKVKTAPQNLYKSVHAFFLDQSNVVLQFDSILLEDTKLVIAMRYDGAKFRIFTIDTSEIVVDAERRHVQEAKRVTLASLGYTYEKTLDVGQESIVILATKNAVPYAVKLFRRNENFDKYKRVSFVNPSVTLRNFYETERDAYVAIATLESFQPLQKMVLEFVEGGPLPKVLSNLFVGQSTGEKEDVMVGYIVLRYMDNDLNLEGKKIRHDFDTLFEIRSVHAPAFTTYLEKLEAVMMKLELKHGDLHLYNFFYKRLSNNSFDFRLGDLATMQHAKGAEEWRILRNIDVVNQLNPSSLLTLEAIDALDGRVEYNAKSKILQVDVELNHVEKRFYIVPIPFPESFVKEGKITLRFQLQENFERTLLLQVNEDDPLLVLPKHTLSVNFYKFENPTAFSLERAKEQEVLPTGPLSIYKPSKGKYSTEEWNATIAPFNELMAENAKKWVVTFQKDEMEEGMLKILVNGLTILTFYGVQESDINKLLAQQYLSIEGAEVLAVPRGLLVRVEMRIRKSDRKWRIRFRLKALDMAKFRVVLHEAALAFLKGQQEEKVEITVEEQVRPSVFYHALESTNLIGKKSITLYGPDLRNAEGKTLRQIFGATNRSIAMMEDSDVALNNPVFALKDVRIASLGKQDEHRFIQEFSKANLFVIYAEQVQCKTPYAFAIYNFSHDTNVKSKLMVVDDQSVSVTRFEYMFRTWKSMQPVLFDFETIQMDSYGYGALNYYKDELKDNMLVFTPWLNNDIPLSVVSIPNPPAEDAPLLKLVYDMLKETRSAGAASNVEEETQEEPDEYAQLADDMLDESLFEETSEEGSEEMSVQDVEEPEIVVFADTKATKKNRNDLIDPLFPSTLFFKLQDMSYATLHQSMSFDRWVEKEHVFHFVMEPVDLASTFAVEDIFETSNVVDVLSRSRFNDGSIDIRFAIRKKKWVVVMTVEDTYSAVLAFTKELLAKMVLSPDASDSLLFAFGLLEARQKWEIEFLKCEGEQCTSMLLKAMPGAFPEVNRGVVFSTIQEQMAAFETSGLLDYQNASGLFLSALTKASMLAAIRAQDQKATVEAVLLLICIHEFVSMHEKVDGKYDESQRHLFLSSYSELFPTQLRFVELEPLNKQFNVGYFERTNNVLARPKVKLVSTRKLKTIRRDVEKNGFAQVTLKFAAASST